MKKVIIMRGISGSGKSTWVKKNVPEAVVCSADHHFINDGVYKFDWRELKQAHAACFKKFHEAVTCGLGVIVIDNTNTELHEISRYLGVIELFEYDLEIVRIECDLSVAQARNVHEVPPESVRAQSVRFENLPPYWPKETLVDYRS